MAKPQLLDYLGRPVQIARLKEEVAAPTLGGVRSIVTGHPASGLTPDRLSAILRSAELGDATRYLELAEQMEERDPHYLAVISTRKRQVAQLDFSVEAASDDKDDVANADLVRDWLDRQTLEDDVFDILDAIGKGFSLTEIVWSTSESQWWPDRLVTLQPQWTLFDRETGQILRLKDGSAEGAPLDPFKYVDHRAKAKSGLPIRGGLARVAAWCWMFKNYALKDWVAFAEVYGLPLRVGKYEPGTSPADKATLLRAVTDIASDAAAIIPKSMDLEFVSTETGAAHGLFGELADWCDRQMSKAVLGQTGTTDMQSGGGYAQSKTLDEVRADIEKADAKTLAVTLARDLVRPLVDLNRGPPRSGRYPKLSIGRAESWDAEKMMPVVERFVDMGGRVEMSVIRDRIGLPDPPKTRPNGEPVELLKPKAAAPATTTPENSPLEPFGGIQPRKGVEPRQAASLRVLEVLAAAAAAEPPTADAVDAFTGELEWEPLVRPIVERVIEAIRAAPSLEAARTALEAMLTEAAPTDALQETVARATFEARLLSLLGLDLTGAPGAEA